MELIQAYLDKKLQRMHVLKVRISGLNKKEIDELIEQWQKSHIIALPDHAELHYQSTFNLSSAMRMLCGNQKTWQIEERKEWN